MGTSKREKFFSYSFSCLFGTRKEKKGGKKGNQAFVAHKGNCFVWRWLWANYRNKKKLKEKRKKRRKHFQCGEFGMGKSPRVPIPRLSIGFQQVRLSFFSLSLFFSTFLFLFSWSASLFLTTQSSFLCVAHKTAETLVSYSSTFLFAKISSFLFTKKRQKKKTKSSCVTFLNNG